ncbi:RNA-binding protein 34 [Contarinia nasturtii]|uniref:RNA-binding protein 34 n=1 Tax=Contarinia nasturtii TaxID=265458 RepID=UPI0012D38579|nr:RNA-binding protein 34 [Contarinia nasturtii]
MTEKTLKVSKNKNKQIKLKKQQKQIEPDSDISDSETLGNAPKIDKKELKLISTEVTDLLASLKKEHGIEDETIAVASKVNENKKEGKNTAKAAKAAAAAKKVAKAVAQQPEKKLPVQKQQQQQQKGKANENKKQKQVKPNNVGVKTEAKVNQAQENSPKKNKNKNKKRAATNVEVKSEPTDEPQPKKAKQNPTPKQPGNKKQKQKQEATKPIVKKEEEVDEENDAEEVGDGGAAVKKEHHLKNAVPVFVGNLPVNIKRVKLVKMFKKFGKILSIRIRTNTGKSFLRKAQLNKVPFLIAFIYFETPEAAKASTALSGEKIGDNVITVDLDTKEKATNVKPQNTVVIGNLKYAVTENILRESFKCCGEIEHIRVVQSALGCKGVAFIRFVNPESCGLALKLNGTPILDREVRVEKYKANKATDEKKVKKEKTSKPIQKKKNANKQKQTANDASSPDKKKKKKNKEFLGVKSNVVKKDKVKKKKKFSYEKRLALKVAPKAEKASD